MYLTHGSQASVEGFGDRDGRRGARGTEDHREVSGIGDSSESLVGQVRSLRRHARACLALLAATALLALAAPAQAQTEIWSATLTPASLFNGLGCFNGVPNAECSNTSVLSEDSFTYDSTDYTVFQLFVSTDGSFSFIVDTIITAEIDALTLVVGSTSLVLDDATTKLPQGRSWASSGVSLTAGTAVGVKLTTTPNNPPTAAHKTVTTVEDRAYAFTAGDFGFDDADAGATLASVTIVTVPAAGTLALDGTAVLAAAVVTTAQIDGDMLTFTPARDAHGAPYTTFTFTVNDGTDDSASAYTMTIDVTDAPLPVCGVPDFGTRRNIWTGTVEVEAVGDEGFVLGYGFNSGTGAGSLADDTFSVGANDYTVSGIGVATSGEHQLGLTSSLTTAEVAALKLHVCDTSYDFADATHTSSRHSYTWAEDLDWSPPVVTRTVYLSLPANNAATGEPAITGTARAEQVLTADASPIMDTDGLTDVDFTYQWLRVDADGTSNEEDISGEIAETYTLTTADVSKKVKVKVSFTDELSGEEERTSAAYPSSGTVTVAGPNTAPTAANNTVTTGEDRAYAFEADDFGFADTDTGDTLASVMIVTVPAAGTLALDGTAVMADDVVTEAQIDGDMLTFRPAQDAHGAAYTTFTFTVNDGTVDSASAYTMTIDVTDAPVPVCGVPDIAGAGRRQIWSGTVEVGRGENVGLVYYGFNEGSSVGTLLPSQSFSIGSNSYSIDGIVVTTRGILEFSIGGFGSSLTDREVTALRLHVCDGDYDFNTADDPFNVNTTTWFAASLDWSPPVVTRTLYLSLPANTAATGEPAITGTAQAGQELTADASPIMDTDGLPSSFTYQWVRVDADGMSNPADITDATAATYSLTAADAGKKIKVQVSFTDELSGVEERTSAAYPSSGTVTTATNTTAPALTSVTVTSTPRKESDTYGAREHIEFSMTFDAPVTVTGDPTFAFDLGGPTTASWYAGSGTTTLRFSHVVSGGSSGDEDTNGISWAQNAIALNGGTIAGTDNAVAAVLTHVAQSNLAEHKVDGRTTAVTPATVTVAVTSTPASLADTYGFGETIVITVTVSEAVEVEGDPEFEFSMNNPGESSNPKQATYDRTRSSPTTIVFTYTVQAGDEDSDGIWIGSGSSTFVLDVNDRIRTASQQIDIDRSHPEKGTDAGHKVDGSLGAPTVPPDPTAPTLVLATATTLTIEWTHPGDGGSPLIRNFVHYRVEGTTDWTNWYAGETPVTRAVITNLQSATAYDVRVHSTNAIGSSQWVQSATAFSTLAGNAATGAPTITGTAAVGQPLAVDLTGIEDADGLTNVSYSYQWVRVDADGTSNEVDITDATDATYTLVYADLGKTLKVRVSFDDDGGSTETLTSAATATVTTAAGAPGPPRNLSATVGVGQVVLVWERPDGRAGWSHYEYRSSEGEMIAPAAMWQQVLSSPGTLNQAYFQVVKGLTSGTTHTFQVRAVNAQGGSAPATVTATPISQPSCTIDELGDRRRLWQGQLVAGIHEIATDGKIKTGYGEEGTIETGTLTPAAFTFRSTSYSVYPRTSGDLLTVVLVDPNSNSWYPRDEVVDALRWHVCNTPYDFSNAQTTTPEDLFTSFEGYRWNVGSIWPPGIERTLRLSLPPNHAATGDPVISGTVQVDAELTALTDGIMDDDVLDDVFTYQWVRVDADGTANEEDITDETDATYTLTADDRGKKVKVEVRFVDILGGEETRTSAPTTTLAGVPNTAATGAPTITGTAQVGETLTASTTGIADANGLTSPTYTYQWIRVDGTDEADIASENSSTYILVDADLGTTLKVRVTFDDDASHTETLTSAATATVGAAATGPPTVSTVAVTSTPASGTTYYLAGEVIKFTVTFSAPVTVTGTPKFAFRLGAATRQAAYTSGSNNAALVFARTVQAGEVDRNGISWNAIALALDGGTITQTGATTAASLTHAEQAPLAGHRVDAAPPMQVSASVHGMSLVLVYDEPLDPASMPATGAYTVTATVGATTTNPAVSEVSIYGIWVTLALDAAPAAGATVTLAYAPPASNPVQDEAGNDAPAFSGQSVRLGPPPPPDLKQVMGVGVAPGNAQLVVTWTAVSTATGYTVQWMSSGQGYNIGDRQATVTSGSTTRYTIPSLTNGTEYTVRVIATRTGADDGPPSDEMTGTPRVPPPPPPPVTDLAQVLGVGVAPGNAQLVVTWTAVSTATGYTVQWMSSGQGYNIGDRQATVTSGSTTRYTIPSLTNGTEYTVRVIATRTGADDGPPSDEMTGTPRVPPPPPPVTDLAQVLRVGVAPGNAQLVVTWTAVDNATGYTVQWTSSGQGYNTGDRQATVTSGSTTRYTIPSLTNGTEYTVRVIATRTGADDGPPSDEMTGTPRVPPPPPPPVTDLAQVMGVGVVPGNAQLVVTWTAVDNATGYTVQWMSSGQGYNIGDRQATVTTGSTTRYTIPSLTNGTEYTVRVIATRTGADDGPPSDEMTGTPRVPPPPPPPPVTDLEQVLGVGVVPGNAQLVVTWTAVSTATGYTVQWMSSGQGYNIGDRQATVTSGSTTRYTIPSLTNGTPYTVRVIATRTGATDGPPSAEVTGTPFTTPGAPQHLRGEPGDAQVTLTWDATSSDGGSAILRYEYAIDDSGTWIDAGLDLEATVPGLTNGQQYAFEVRAVNSAGPGAPARTEATPLGMPSVPESLTATGGDGEVVLEWTEPADDGGSPVTGYGYRYAAGQAVPEDVTWRDAGTELTATVSGLENETRYTFEVRARNRVGPGETSGTTALPLRLRAELFSSAAAAEGEALVVGVRRSGRLAFPAHAYIGVTDSALPGVTATEEGRDDGLGRHRLEFAAGAAEATVTVTVAFDGELRQDRVLSATLDSAELEVDGVRRPYELVTPTLVVPVTEGDAALSVADARVQGKSSVLAFTVSLDRTRDVAVRVDYATQDGSARAGEDYTPVSGTLTIEAGGRERTVEVPVLPALHVTGERTLTLRLSNAVSAVIDDGVATGVIVRESELPKAWLARFGRTASDHAAQAIARRLEAGQRETQVTVAGRRVDGLSVDGLLLGALPSGGWRPASAVEDMATRLAAPALAASGAPFGGVDADPGTPGLRAGTWGGAPGALDREPFADAGQTLRRAVLPDFGFRLPGAEEALMGTSFYVERGAQQDVGGGTWAAWGDVAATRFEGDAGGLALNGDVVTGTAGLDRQWRAVLVGLALSRSSGEGGYGTGAGTIASTLTSVHPYVQVRLGERAQVWGAAGWGRGGLEITPESGAMLEADLTNRMGALGARAVLMGAGGLEIALRSDFLWTETASDGTAALAEAVGTASRGRLMLEGAGQIQGLGGVVRPKVEGGVRYDGGDAETGRGFEVGGGLDWARGSLTLQVNGRMLVAHADESYEEWGYSGSLVYEPGADGLGLQMRVGSSAGAAASGIRNLWALENASGLVRGGAVPFAQRFDAEVGYGIGRGTLWYPYFVADDSGRTRYGLKLSSGRTMGVGLEFGRRESVDLGPEDAMLLRGELRF